jgi:hypothetical protein
MFEVINIYFRKSLTVYGVSMELNEVYRTIIKIINVYTIDEISATSKFHIYQAINHIYDFNQSRLISVWTQVEKLKFMYTIPKEDFQYLLNEFTWIDLNYTEDSHEFIYSEFQSHYYSTLYLDILNLAHPYESLRNILLNDRLNMLAALNSFIHVDYSIEHKLEYCKDDIKEFLQSDLSDYKKNISLAKLEDSLPIFKRELKTFLIDNHFWKYIDSSI